MRRKHASWLRIDMDKGQRKGYYRKRKLRKRQWRRDYPSLFYFIPLDKTYKLPDYPNQ